MLYKVYALPITWLSIGVTCSLNSKSPFLEAIISKRPKELLKKIMKKISMILQKKIHQTNKFCDDSMKNEKRQQNENFNLLNR